MSISQKILHEMTARRRDFHRYPETGWTEYRTTAKIAEALTKIGYEVHYAGEFIQACDVMGRHIDAGAERARAIAQGASEKFVEAIKNAGDYTGLYVDFKTGRPGPSTVLRFDIDCVDAVEATCDHFPAQEGFASANPGMMHACAHDGHAAIGVALAESLQENEDLCGTIRLIFQPAEEGVRGGYAMARARIADDADFFIAMHLGLGRPTGCVYGGIDSFLCTTKFDADYRGFGAHAGAEPQKGKNALLAAATAALNLHAIAPSSEGITRINVGVLNAGEGRNVIAPSAHMKIETRGETNELASYVYDRAVRIIQGAAEMHDVDVSIAKQGEANTANSSPELAARAAAAARHVAGVTEVGLNTPMTGSDDACWFMKRVQEHAGQATYIGIGATTPAGHHNSRFDFDEAAMPIALETLYRLLQDTNGCNGHEG